MVLYDISNQELLELPIIPNGITHLDISNNYIMYINTNQLPLTLVELICNHNDITYVDDLSHFTNLQVLNLNNNKLDYLPKIPSNLTIFLFTNNNIKYLYDIKDTFLVHLDCSYNKLQIIPELPSTLIIYNANNNNLLNNELYEQKNVNEYWQVIQYLDENTFNMKKAYNVNNESKQTIIL